MENQTANQGVHQIPNLGFSNAYLVEATPDSLILIDTGTSSAGPKIVSYLEKIGKKPGNISHIILTHADADHSGSAAMLKRLSSAKLAIHELDAPRISGENKKIKETNGLSGAILTLVGSLMKVERVKPDLLLKDRDSVGPLTIVHTPGHTDGSICIYKPCHALFVGDTLRTDGSGELKLPSSFMSRNMDELRTSVEKISKLEFSMLLPGHGKPIAEDASHKVREFVANSHR
ncbi:MAG TPA: MBL fold metallo-hydrolase [Nitrososphaerales archaeon]|nr:MBL fold metallo-hydrolase [Nitrososphaerales archaeon]